jgi:hypothetical protein
MPLEWGVLELVHRRDSGRGRKICFGFARKRRVLSFKNIAIAHTRIRPGNTDTEPGSTPPPPPLPPALRVTSAAAKRTRLMRFILSGVAAQLKAGCLVGDLGPPKTPRMEPTTGTTGHTKRHTKVMKGDALA